MAARICRPTLGLLALVAVAAVALCIFAVGARGGMRSGLRSSAVSETVNEDSEGACAKAFVDNCVHKPCCGEYTTCFEKSPGEALCRPACALGAPDSAPPWDPEADGKPWTCKIVGDQPEAPTWKPSSANPSLYCFAVTLVRGNEPELLRRQLTTGTGVFGCNAYDVFSEREMVLGEGPEGLVKTVEIGGPMSTVARNTADFLRAYEKIVKSQVHMKHDWSLKVDPDTLLIAHRLRPKLARHWEISPVWTPMYFRNCEKYKSVQGPLELFTQAAAKKYFAEFHKCKADPYIMKHGEDWFFGHCMENLAIKGVEDFELLDDNYCMHHMPEVQCKRDMPAVHPFKTTEAYMSCLEEIE